MRVLFICSTLPNGNPSPIIANQAKSLKDDGFIVSFFLIKSKGLKGYLKELFRLHSFLKSNYFNIYHAHYGLSAIVATLSGAKPLVVSLMGSDVKEGGWQQWLIKRFAKRRWAATIAKSHELADIVGNKYCIVIPNGVDMDVFKPLPKNQCRSQLNLKQNKTYVLFAANPKRPEKNFDLTKYAFNQLNLKDSELLYLQNIPHRAIPVWMNAVDVVVLSSLWEGSPNAIKEAMACNKPIVVTNVGDVQWLFGSEPGHFIAEDNSAEFAEKIHDALVFLNKYVKTNGRDRLKALKLDSKSVAKKIISIYSKVNLLDAEN